MSEPAPRREGSAQGRPSPERRGTARVESLSDGIFAFAMTLLVLSIDVPQVAHALAPKLLPGLLLGMWPKFFVFMLSFMVISSFWVGHHQQFAHIKYVDRRLLLTNTVALMLIVLIPFSTSLIGEYGDAQIAVVFYEMNMLLAGLAYLVQWRYATKARRLTDPDLSSDVIDDGVRRNLTIPAISLLAIAVSFLTPSWSLASYALGSVFGHRGIPRLRSRGKYARGE